jgi:hypothetical protein
MVLVPKHHELGTKRLLDNAILPPAWGSQADSSNTNFDNYCLHDLEAALDSIFNNQNVGPLVCRELIQRLVTSNPSREYLYRVVQKFNDNGSGVRGDLQAVIQAILLDYEARSSAMTNQPTFGKQREPLLRATALARAFAPARTGGSYNQNNAASISITTTNVHRRITGDGVFLTFTDTSGQIPPPAQGYTVTVTGPSTFTIPAPDVLSGSYGQTNGTITVNVSGHGLAVGNPVFMAFTSGPATNGVYQVVSVPDSSHLTLTNASTATNSGTCLLPKWAISGTGGFSQSKTNITVTTPFPHGLNAGDNVFIVFPTSNPVVANSQYQVLTVPDANHFTIVVVANGTQTQNTLTVYPLVAPAASRSGTVNIEQGSWAMGYTDNNAPTASTAQLFQTPLRSPTVFNFFFPNFSFPGTLASAGLTTPEFQLTSDTSAALQMNFLEGACLSGSNTNGLGGFIAANDAILVDFGPWMIPSLTSNAGLPGLVDALNTLLIGGRLAPGAKTSIVNYATTLPYTTPKATEMRDRVRAVVHLLTTSTDFTIQK